MCMEQKLIMWHGIVVPMMICMFVRAYTCACMGTYAVWGKKGDSRTFPYCTASVVPSLSPEGAVHWSPRVSFGSSEHPFMCHSTHSLNSYYVLRTPVHSHYTFKFIGLFICALANKAAHR